MFQRLTEKKYLIPSLITFSGILVFAATFLLPGNNKNLKAAASDAGPELGSFPIVKPTLKYGFALDTFQVLERKIQSGQNLGDLLIQQKLDYPAIDQIVRNSEGVFNVKNLRAGSSITILTKDSTQAAEYLVYEPSVYEFIVFQLKNELKVERIQREVTTEVRSAGGTVESSLWKTMANEGFDFELISKMEDALQWSIDFHHIQQGDEFKLVYEQKFIEGQPVGVGGVFAAYYKNYDNEYHAIYFENDQYKGYYDLEGRPMKKSFLKAPVKYSRISSYYNLNRFHPILKRTRPHFGTDYAAPYGTEIYAVGDGVVLQASYTSGNGNFVKIKHDDTYQTQYLHMQKIARGIRPGVHVRQGQVIGYVGSTGLATGPHVCFRFWKNGKQVNHLKLNFPPPLPLPKEDLPKFFETRDHYMDLLSQIRTSSPEADLISDQDAGLQEEKAEADNP